MGAIKSKELTNGTVELEITYGGPEAPFGGVDTSAPPAYIDPRCFVEGSGALIANQKLFPVSLQPLATPTLWGNVAGVKLIGYGTFYNSIYGQLNYALGYTATAETSAPAGIEYKFYMTSWNPSNLALVYDDIFPLTLFNAGNPAQAASITLPLIDTNSPVQSIGSGASFTITVIGGSIDTVSIVTPGINFTPGDLLNLYQGAPGLGAGGNGWIRVLTVDVSGGITSVGIFNAWFGFVAGAVSWVADESTTQVALCFPFTNAGNSVGAAVAVTVVNTDGQITGLTVSGGTGAVVGDFYIIRQGTNTSAVIVVQTVNGSGGILTWDFASYHYFAGIGAGAAYVVGAAILTPAGTIVSVEIGSNTVAQQISAMAGQINADALMGTLVVAAPSADGLSLIITAIATGTGGNAYNVQDLSYTQAYGYPPTYYFPCRDAVNFQGGVNNLGNNDPQALIGPASITSVGGTLYIGNLGPFILQYSGPSSLSILTMNNGVRVIGKFGGSLIGLGKVSPPGIYDKDEDMIFLWSAADKPSVWSPVDAAGLVTGAGFEQLADISDALTGLIVSNGTAFIIRAEGLSYVTPTGNELIPFSTAHIGLGAQGEGSQLPFLVAQYDLTGVFVGNTDVWQLTGQISSIGKKIRSAIFSALQSVSADLLAATAGAVWLGDEEFPLAAFAVGNVLYVFNTSNGTWTTLTYYPQTPPSGFSLARVFCSSVASSDIFTTDGKYSQNLVSVAYQQLHSGMLQVPQFFVLKEQLPDIAATSASFSVSFVQEEVSFGRDVTIDALYIALNAQLSANITMSIYISGVLYSVVALAAADYTSLNVTPVELQVFPTTVDVFTAHSPQLKIVFTNAAGTPVSKVRFSKITMFGSFDAKQRPV